MDDGKASIGATINSEVTLWYKAEFKAWGFKRLTKHVSGQDCCRGHKRGRFDRRFALKERRLT